MRQFGLGQLAFRVGVKVGPLHPEAVAEQEFGIQPVGAVRHAGGQHIRDAGALFHLAG